MVSAVSGVNGVLQDMMDRGKLRDSDFRVDASAAAALAPAPAPAPAPVPSPAPASQAQLSAPVARNGSNGGLGSGAHPQTAWQAAPGSEEAFLSALQANELTRIQALSQASGINSAELTILLPSELLHNVLVPRGIMSEVAQRLAPHPKWPEIACRSGSRIDVGAEGPARMLQVTLTGQMVGNAMAALLLQEQARERRFRQSCAHRSIQVLQWQQTH